MHNETAPPALDFALTLARPDVEVHKHAVAIDQGLPKGEANDLVGISMVVHAAMRCS